MRRITVALAVAIALSSCGDSGASRTASVSPGASPSSNTVASSEPSSAPSAASPAEPSPSPVPDLPLSAVTLSCRLPVFTQGAAGGTSWTGGFVTFPGATYQSDPAGVLINRATGDMATAAQPVLYGVPQTGPPFYDLALKRWLPVGSGQTSPDGSSYAYAVSGPSSTDPTDVHVVTVATGADRVLKVSPPPQGAALGWEVGDFDGRYVYLLGEQFEQFPRGVWRLDASTGTLVQISQSGPVLLLRGADLWVGVVNPADPSPPKPPRSGQLFDSLAEVNLTTGAQNTWIYRPGEEVYLLGLDGSGLPVVSIADGPDFNVFLGKVLVLARPGDTGTQISNGILSYFQMQADAGRIWFGSQQGIYVWTEDGALQKVFASGQPITPAGHCV